MRAGLRWAVAWCVAAGVCVAAGGPAAAQPAAAEAATWSAAAAVGERDRLVDVQEALLNVYRCWFGVDVEAVPGGCLGGAPAIAAAGPAVWVLGESGLTAHEDIELRDRLIAAQEALLNLYRCRFGVDVEVVPGGCGLAAAGGPVSGGPVFEGAGWYPDPTCRYDERWWHGSPGRGGWDIRARWRGSEPVEDSYVGYLSGSERVGLPGPGSAPACAAAGPAESLPAGQRLASLSVGGFQRCLLRVDGILTCRGGKDSRQRDFFGFFPDGRPAVLTGRFQSVSAGERHSCAVRADGTALCWGQNFGESSTLPPSVLDPPAGRYSAVSAGNSFSCGLRADRTIACWGEDTRGETAAPSGRFDAVSAGADHACGVRADQSVACWGNNEHGALDAPAGRFDAVSAGSGFSCGLRADHTIACWGSQATPQPANDGHVIATTDGHALLISRVPNPRLGIRHFDTSNAYGELDAPAGRFDAVSASETFACGLRANGAIECWGRPTRGSDANFVLSSKHPRQFTSISTTHSIGEPTVCGVRGDGTAECYSLGERGFPNTFRFPRTGRHDVHVYYCVSQGASYTEDGLANEVDRLNRTAGEFYTRESSGLATVRFLAGGILTPITGFNQPSATTTADKADPSLLCPPFDSGDSAFFYFKPELDKYYLVLGAHPIYAEYAETHSPQFARPDKHLAAVHTVENYREYYHDIGYKPNTYESSYWYVVLHELGHAVFDFGHPPDCSVMGTGYFVCPHLPGPYDYTSVARLLDDFYVGCRDRRMTGWPEDSEQCQEPLREAAH